MTAQPLAPVIPSSAVPSGRQLARVAGRQPLPLARPAPAPPTPEDVVYGIGRIDSSGRIADRTVTTALGWRGGDRLILTADAGIVTARRDPGGMVTLPARAYITIPAVLRRRCGLHRGMGSLSDKAFVANQIRRLCRIMAIILSRSTRHHLTGSLDCGVRQVD
jgi:hypothetical protein